MTVHQATAPVPDNGSWPRSFGEAGDLGLGRSGLPGGGGGRGRGAAGPQAPAGAEPCRAQGHSPSASEGAAGGRGSQVNRGACSKAPTPSRRRSTSSRSTASSPATRSSRVSARMPGPPVEHGVLVPADPGDHGRGAAGAGLGHRHAPPLAERGRGQRPRPAGRDRPAPRRGRSRAGRSTTRARLPDERLERRALVPLAGDDRLELGVAGLEGDQRLDQQVEPLDRDQPAHRHHQGTADRSPPGENCGSTPGGDTETRSGGHARAGRRSPRLRRSGERHDRGSRR